MPISDDFFRGILTTLEILSLHDERTIFDEIVQAAGEKNIIRVARKDGEMRRSGLTHYGYGKNTQLPLHPVDVADAVNPGPPTQA